MPKIEIELDGKAYKKLQKEAKVLGLSEGDYLSYTLSIGQIGGYGFTKEDRPDDFDWDTYWKVLMRRVKKDKDWKHVGKCAATITLMIDEWRDEYISYIEQADSFGQNSCFDDFDLAVISHLSDILLVGKIEDIKNYEEFSDSFVEQMNTDKEICKKSTWKYPHTKG